MKGGPAAVSRAAEVLARCRDRDLASAAPADVIEFCAALRVLRAEIRAAEARVVHAARNGHGFSPVLVHGTAGWSLWIDDWLLADHGGLAPDQVRAARDWAAQLIARTGATVVEWAVAPDGRGAEQHHALVLAESSAHQIARPVGPRPVLSDKETQS